MIQTNEPKDRDRLDRQLRVFERRLTRLEETQLTSREVNLGFDLVNEKIDALEDRSERRLDWLEARFDRLEARVESRFNELERKLDLTIARSRDKAKIVSD
jgi:hypothetical protein